MAFYSDLDFSVNQGQNLKSAGELFLKSTVDTSSLSEGLFLVEIKINKGQGLTKLVIQF